MTKKESIIILFSITLCWSSSYVFIKDIPQEFSVYAYLALTSGVAGIILTFVMRRKLRLLNRVSLRQGLILGALITASNMLEKMGLDRIPASSASVYASMSIIIVPLILILKKQYPSRNNWAGIVIIVIGILTSNFGKMGGAGLQGALYILGSTTAMSVYTVLATEYTKETDPSLLTVLQMLVSAVFGFALWMATDAGSLFTIEWSEMTLSFIFLIAFFSKCYAYMMLMYADKYADAVSVTIVASTEPVVTLLAAVLLPEALGGVEEFSTKAIAGAVIISLGAIVAGTNFLSKKSSTRGADGDGAAGAATNSVATAGAAMDAAGTAADAASAAAGAATNVTATDEATNSVATVVAVADAVADAVAGAVADAKDAVANATSNEAVNAVADAVAGAAVDAVTDAAANVAYDEHRAAEMGFETTVKVFEGREAKENDDHETAAALPMMPAPARIFVLIVGMFAILSVSINVMQFAGGLSEIRPVNAIPAPVGLVFGPVGALACALGNLLGDMAHFERYGGTVVLGAVGNFALAYIPYKVWRAMDGDAVCVHSWRQIGLFVWSTAIGCMFCALLLGFGLETAFGQYYEELIPVTFSNNLVFSITFGLPALIVLTSMDFGLGIWATLMLRMPGNFKMPGIIPNRFASAVCCVDTVVLGAAYVMARQRLSLGGNPVMKVVAVLAVACAAATCLMEGREAKV